MIVHVATLPGQTPETGLPFASKVFVHERTLGASHLNTAIGRVKLGRTLLRQHRFAEAERETLAGLEILQSQASSSVSWITSARADLADIYEALGRPTKAEEFRKKNN